MIRPVEGPVPVQISPTVKGNGTFKEILQHEMAITIEKVATPDGLVIYDKQKTKEIKEYLERMKHGAH